ncbi:alpha/beta fold hydrolase [Amnibacterium endophyticum]|uniref:Alpha/beta fold hydrolase n=1 Tax=Amnibacterium endophyticum TaxID=2109337 RepID=A0ABW4LCX5_9MICO
MTGSPPGLHVVDRVVEVPLDRSGRLPGTLRVFAREVTAAHRRHEDLPLLLFLQGGPGGASPRPLDASGWLGALLERFRVVLLDQRGTGRSTPVDAARIAALGTDGGAYLACFRADAIVEDAEHLRRTVYGGRRWATLGQSYGGFVTLAYLSRHPEALTACLVTGGLPAVRPDAVEVYRRTFPAVLAAGDRYDTRYPQDVPVLARIADRLAEDDVRLPDGDRLTVRRLQLIGTDLGMQHGAERLHALLDTAWSGDRLSDAFLHRVLALTAYAANPLYMVLQEAIYGDGSATGWAAEAERRRHPAFAEGARPLRLTGEAVFSWMFRDIRLLRPFEAAAESIATRNDWPPLHDPDRLAGSAVPVAAAVYADDLFVPLELSLRTAAEVGSVTPWVTDEWQHDGLRISGDRVVRHLLRLLDEQGALAPQSSKAAGV